MSGSLTQHEALGTSVNHAIIHHVKRHGFGKTDKRDRIKIAYMALVVARLEAVFPGAYSWLYTQRDMTRAPGLQRNL